MDGITRRGLLGAGGAALLPGVVDAATKAAGSDGPFQPNWESLIANYQAPDWFRDAKLGFWAHWGLQCIPSAGSWYAREMYIQGSRSADHHRKVYGHPSEFGWMDIIPTWKVDHWDPDRLVGLYKKAGGRYFVALSAHHDNFDNYASSHHEWNSVRMGPKRDLIGGWARATRKHGLPFGVSDHSAHSWHWYQPAYGYDPEGPMRGRRYDAYTRTREMGKGKWWEGADPQALYTGRNMVMPDGITSIADADAYHRKTDRVWTEKAPTMNPAFTARWLARNKELVTKYRPDLLYFDNFDIPLEQAGLDLVSYFYNANQQWHGGRLNAVVNAKMIPPARQKGLVEDVERGGKPGIADHPWQTDTCIGDWFYDKGIYEKGGYKTARTMIHTLADIVSKNGNLLLSIPVRPDGSIDDKEEAIVAEMGRWMADHGSSIHGTRPWHAFGEGPNGAGAGMFNEVQDSKFDARDIRYTTKAGALYALVMGWPADGVVRLTLLGGGKLANGANVQQVRLTRDGTALQFRSTADALEVTLPQGARDPIAVALSIQGRGIV